MRHVLLRDGRERPSCSPRTHAAVQSTIRVACFAVLWWASVCVPLASGVTYDVTVVFELKSASESVYTPVYEPPESWTGWGTCRAASVADSPSSQPPPFPSRVEANVGHHSAEEDVRNRVERSRRADSAAAAAAAAEEETPSSINLAAFRASFDNPQEALQGYFTVVNDDEYLLDHGGKITVALIDNGLTLSTSRYLAYVSNYLLPTTAPLNMRDVAFFFYNQPRLHCMYNAPALLDILGSRDEAARMRALEEAVNCCPLRHADGEDDVATAEEEVAAPPNVIATSAPACSCGPFMPSTAEMVPPVSPSLLPKSFMQSEVNLQVMVFDADTWYRLTDGARAEEEDFVNKGLMYDSGATVMEEAKAAVTAPAAAGRSRVSPRSVRLRRRRRTRAQRFPYNLDRDPAKICSAPALYTIPLGPLISVYNYGGAEDHTALYFTPASLPNITHAYTPVRVVVVIAQCSAIPLTISLSISLTNSERQSGSAHFYYVSVMLYVFVVCYAVIFVILLAMIVRCEKRDGTTQTAKTSTAAGTAATPSEKKRESRSRERASAGASGGDLDRVSEDQDDDAGQRGHARRRRQRHHHHPRHRRDRRHRSRHRREESSASDNDRGSNATDDGYDRTAAEDAEEEEEELFSLNSSSSPSSSDRSSRGSDSSRNARERRHQSHRTSRRSRGHRRDERGSTASAGHIAGRQVPSAILRCFHAAGDFFQRGFFAFQAWWSASHIDIMFPALQWILVVLIPLKCLIVILRAADFSLLSGMTVVSTSNGLYAVSLIFTVAASTALFVLEVLVALGWGLAFGRLTVGRIVVLTLACICGFVINVATSTCLVTGWSTSFTRNANARAMAVKRCQVIDYTTVAVETFVHYFNAIMMVVLTDSLGKTVRAYVASPHPPLTEEDLRFYYRLTTPARSHGAGGGRKRRPTEKRDRAATASPPPSRSSGARQTRGRQSSRSSGGSSSTVGNLSEVLGAGGINRREAVAMAEEKRRQDLIQTKLMKLFLRYRGMRAPFCVVALWPTLFLCFSFTFFDREDHYMKVFFDEIGHLYLLCFIILFMRHDSFFC